MACDVLMIGGSRFLGAAITRAFVERGDRVWVLNRGTRSVPCDGVESVVCDKSDRGTFASALKQRNWDVMVDTILGDEDLSFVVDTLGTDVGMFIHTGSLGVYGAAQRLPAMESDPLCEHDGEVVVFNNKLRQDQVLIRAFHEKAFPGAVLRMSYIYGAGDIPLDGWGGRSAEFFRRLRGGKTVPLPGSGKALLHPGHVKDLARSFICAARNPGALGQIYNIGGPSVFPMADYVRALADAMGVEARLEFATVEDIMARFPEHTNERGMRFSTQHMFGSIAKAGAELGWQPEVPLAAGLRENIEWMREQGHV